MQELFRVTVHVDNDYGYVEYNPANKQINIVWDNEAKVKVEDYLNAAHVVNVPHDTLRDFSPITVNPKDSIEDLKLALTRMWGETGVFVDWSYPHNYTQITNICG